MPAATDIVKNMAHPNWPAWTVHRFDRLHCHHNCSCNNAACYFRRNQKFRNHMYQYMVWGNYFVSTFKKRDIKKGTYVLFLSRALTTRPQPSSIPLKSVNTRTILVSRAVLMRSAADKKIESGKLLALCQYVRILAAHLSTLIYP